MIQEILLMLVVYVVGFAVSFKFMFNFFKRDRLSDLAFKLHVTFLSSIWPLFWTVWVSVLFIPLICIYPICWVLDKIQEKRNN